jgi:hypothetical protein
MDVGDYQFGLNQEAYVTKFLGARALTKKVCDIFDLGKDYESIFRKGYLPVFLEYLHRSNRSVEDGLWKNRVGFCISSLENQVEDLMKFGVNTEELRTNFVKWG